MWRFQGCHDGKIRNVEQVFGFTMNSTSELNNHRCFWWTITGAMVILSFGPIISRWLGLYGGAALVCVVCIAVIWPMRISDPQFDIANVLLLFVAYYFLMFGGYGFMNAFGLSHYLGAGYDPREDSASNLSSLASVYAAGVLLAVYAGYAWTPRRGTWRTQPLISLDRGNQQTVDLKRLNRLRISALAAIFLSYTGVVLLIYFLGGSSIIGRDPSEVATVGTHGLYWAQSLIWANHWALIVNLFSFTVLKKFKYLLLALLSVPVFIMEFLLSGSKSAILFPLMGFLIVRHYCYQRINWKTVAALTVAVALVFAAGYAYRSTGAQATEFGQGLSSFYQNPLVLLETFVGRFYGTDTFAMVLDSVRGGRPLLKGASFVDLFTWYIPRWLWQGKPLSYSLTFGEEFISKSLGGGEVFFSPSLPGELYLNFGWLGLSVGGIACGRFLRYMHHKMIEGIPRRIESIVLYSVIAPLAASLSGGPISVILEFIMTRVIIYVLLFWFAGIIVGPGGTTRRLATTEA